ncbi:MAG: hypothetical protein ACYS22_13475 [Planctomycetota bacterium]|jgi:hypothetical protein
MRIEGPGKSDVGKVHATEQTAPAEQSPAQQPESQPHDHAQARADRGRIFASAAFGESVMRAQFDQLLTEGGAEGGSELGRGANISRTQEAQARAQASEVADQTFSWDNPEAGLENIGQYDADGVNDGNDRDRCGPACLTAGLALMGPQATANARTRLQSRIDFLQGRNEGDSSISADRRENADYLLGEAEMTLEDLPENPETWTNGQMQQFQTAIYNTAHVEEERRVMNVADDRPTAEHIRVDIGLHNSTMREYRDLMWGGRQPTYTLGDRELPVDLSNEDGHFRLVGGRVGEARASGSGRSSVFFDPLPQGSEHDAYSMGSDTGSQYDQRGTDLDNVTSIDHARREQLRGILEQTRAAEAAQTERQR